MAVEVRGRSSAAASLVAPKTVAFADLRDDWYRGADLMARLIAQSATGRVRLLGFPAQWAPMFEYFGAHWSELSAPVEFVPLVSSLPTAGWVGLVDSARENGRLRVVVEAVASLDPLVADVLHRLDRRADLPRLPQDRVVQFTGWQSYGRAEVLALERRIVASASADAPTAVLLPCARRRPYHNSKTHRRLSQALSPHLAEPFDRIVVSSLGVIPEKFWTDSVVVSYDSGVPDIYRVLRLMREFFKRARYETVVNCLEFEPYRDCLRILEREGLVRNVIDGPTGKLKKLPAP